MQKHCDRLQAGEIAAGVGCRRVVTGSKLVKSRPGLDVKVLQAAEGNQYITECELADGMLVRAYTPSFLTPASVSAHATIRVGIHPPPAPTETVSSHSTPWCRSCLRGTCRTRQALDGRQRSRRGLL
eukprot:352160-Chlamydomonas_euryale.AAC.2